MLNNKIKKGKLISEIDIFLTDKGSLKNFITRGAVKDLEAELFSDLNLTKGSLRFFADKNDILVKNIFGLLGDIEISDGDIKLNLDNGVKLNSSFNSKLDFDEKLLKKYAQILKQRVFNKKFKKN